MDVRELAAQVRLGRPRAVARLISLVENAAENIAENVTGNAAGPGGGDGAEAGGANHVLREVMADLATGAARPYT
ncbi:methylmalonyl Co-A mutase-associated GTPase MeaB, partial [Microbispora triticiradicis]|nr:methylmalonyl Co-A mutase-associated GTPase MeaB [Microbispora triticiradicis]